VAARGNVLRLCGEPWQGIGLYLSAHEVARVGAAAPEVTGTDGILEPVSIRRIAIAVVSAAGAGLLVVLVVSALNAIPSD
jgi:hypothetical protein